MCAAYVRGWALTLHGLATGLPGGHCPSERALDPDTVMPNQPLLDAMHSDVRIRALLTHIDAAATGDSRGLLANPHSDTEIAGRRETRP